MFLCYYDDRLGTKINFVTIVVVEESQLSYDSFNNMYRLLFLYMMYHINKIYYATYHYNFILLVCY